jgi:hypothetical protein
MDTCLGRCTTSPEELLEDPADDRPKELEGEVAESESEAELDELLEELDEELLEEVGNPSSAGFCVSSSAGS